MAASFFASAGLMIGQSGIEALFFARYGVSKLPVMYLVLGGTMFVVDAGLRRTARAVGARARVHRRSRSCSALVASLGRIALAGDIAWITPALWLLQGVA